MIDFILLQLVHTPHSLSIQSSDFVSLAHMPHFLSIQPSHSVYPAFHTLQLFAVVLVYLVLAISIIVVSACCSMAQKTDTKYDYKQ